MNYVTSRIDSLPLAYSINMQKYNYVKAKTYTYIK